MPSHATVSRLNRVRRQFATVQRAVPTTEPQSFRVRERPAVSHPAVGLHRFALCTAAATFTLVFLGGLVTSTGSALAVPDWPLSFGQVMPPMVGGVLFEHGHRLAASAVGLLTVILAGWIVRRETRPAVRGLAVAAVIAVIAQGLLGGITVLYKLPVAVSVSHACLGQTFFCLTVALALVTSPSWHRTIREPASPAAAMTVLTCAVAFAQLVAGAMVRHLHAGLAIPDFPLAFGRLVPPFETVLITTHFAHRVGALFVTAVIAMTTVTVLRHHGHQPLLRRPALLLAALVLAQVLLGASIVWTRRAVLPTTAHQTTGAAILATSLVLALRTRRMTAASEPASHLVADTVAA
jgi:heme a synthase